MEHILRLPDEILIRKALPHYYVVSKIERQGQIKEGNIKIIPYLRRLIRKAGMKVSILEECTSNCLDWKVKVKKRQLQVDEYEKQQEQSFIIAKGTDKVYRKCEGFRRDGANVCTNLQ